MYEEIFAGMEEDPAQHFEVTFDEHHEEMVLVKDIPFYSMCEHHLVPFFGHAHVAYIPRADGRICGLSMLARLVDAFAKCPQVQERLTSQIAHTLIEHIEPQGVMVVLEAEYICMSMRGKARETIKQLVADGRYDYIETGSLMSIRKNEKDILISSEERPMRLNPFDFEVFLWAMDEKPMADTIEDSFVRRKPMPTSLHRKAMRLFREYMLVGGMPQAVQKYINTRSFEDVDEVKRDILTLYRNDIAKHSGTATHRVTSVFDNIDGQLSKHEKRFNIASLGKNARMRDYEDAFFWLSDAFITNNCFNSADPDVGLKINEDRTTVKCYMADTGLLVTHALASSGATYRDMLLEKIGQNEGMFTENIVAQQLRAHGRELFSTPVVIGRMLHKTWR